MTRKLTSFVIAIIIFFTSCSGEETGLLKEYPATLSGGIEKPENALEWNFSEDDVYRVSKFEFNIADLKIEMGAADVGIGHATGGALWAVVMPREEGKLSSSRAKEEETVDHIWLRFHPAKLNQLFPPSTLVEDEKVEDIQFPLMRRIAHTKLRNSYHAGWNLLVPPPPQMIFDVDTKNLRRFYIVDLAKKEARYEAFFEKQRVPPLPKMTKEEAEKSFDQIWNAFDKQYAMFAIRPKVDWRQLKKEYRPQAIEAENSYEFAYICSKMLAELQDLHIKLYVGKERVPVFSRPRPANANPQATDKIIGEIHKVGPNVNWGLTDDHIGYITITAWSDEKTPEHFDFALEEMRNTRGLIVDVRMNGGGGEGLAKEVGGRFLKKEVIYAYSQYRSGPDHDDLTDKIPRKVEPRGPWRYDRPVLLLIGQRCLSSNEAFVAIMDQAPKVTIMGDKTGGSSGNPTRVQTPIGVSVTLPRWISLLKDGQPLDERGIIPDIVFEPDEDAFKDGNDDLLVAAVEWMKEKPLPAEPITGPKVKPSLDHLKKRSWAPEQVLGGPDVTKPGSSPKAWAPADPNSPDEWLLLSFGQLVNATCVKIYENHHPGAVYKVSAFNTDGQEEIMWEGDDPIPTDHQNGIAQIPFKQIVKTDRIKVYINSSKVAGSNEIDAVGLVDETDEVYWAQTAEASSSFAEIMEPMVIEGEPEAPKRDWGPERATGEPDTMSPGDAKTAWSPKTKDGQKEWLILEYDNSVKPEIIRIYETFNPGAVYQIGLYDENNQEIIAWQGDDPTSPNREYGASEIKLNKSILTQKIKIYLDSPNVPGFNQIDAVGLIDQEDNIYWAAHAEASSTFAK